MRVRFEWFWPTFDRQNNFFVDALKILHGEVEVVTDRLEHCDLEVVSVFSPQKNSNLNRLSNLRKKIPHGQPDTNLLYPTKFDPDTKNFSRRIWYGVENVRAPYQLDIDGYISFDQDTLDGYNAYFATWYELSGIQLPFTNNRVGLTTSASELLEKRSFFGRKSKFACAFIGKPDQMRFRAINELRKIGEVDVFGPMVGKPISNKPEIAKDYKYMVCLENDNYPGYVTEKLLEAYLSDTVPLYWGNLGNDSSINRKGFSNLLDFESMSEWIEYVRNIDEYAYVNMYEQAHLNNVPDLTPIYNVLVG
ncbi:unannotated protein [freshwater metagenome]|uniref:Unannotated protein n=1 Tax=freshwater metagenome TaxID=449393 RepID=A0A6J5YZ34_9ZZZZ|nr:hypothetical protein [Actinomycetota bacterium]MSW25676.1 hypothetical protein [Actinomycetota bacterium]MSW33408.1 hypothetical protein [Actinomycetota bacterium]MSX30432.1 hypothetical protein [Actinomycetota bacterium]MSX51336.1 hypothetical protein [Actinomycetota bacterium]